MRIEHIGLLVSDLNRAALFYEKILGLSCIERPDLGFEGIWYGLDNGQQIHLMLLFPAAGYMCMASKKTRSIF
jgi:catechol 2,3-dioxygenase-like lactoylglutathione lyase family enzyme